MSALRVARKQGAFRAHFATSERYFFSAETDPHEARRLFTLILVAYLAPFGLAQAFGWRSVARVSLVAGLVTVLVVSGAFVGGYDVAPHRDFDHNRGFNL